MVEMMKYPSLTNHYNLGKLSEEKLKRINEMEWYATEKIDGSNISISIDLETGEWVFASRNREINETTPTFCVLYELISEKSIQNMKMWANGLMLTTGTLHIYGELFGGNIQRQDYNANNENTHSVEFFDAIVSFNGRNTKLSFDELVYIAGTENIIVPTSYGSLKELITKEPSTVSSYGGQSEGVVYKPVERFTFMDGQNYLGIKHKSKEYMEKRNIKSKEGKLPYRSTELDERILAYVVPQRLFNVISHGDIDPKPQNIGKLIGEVRKDIIKEFAEENEFELSFVSSNMNGYIMKQVANMVREEILKGDW